MQARTLDYGETVSAASAAATVLADGVALAATAVADSGLAVASMAPPPNATRTTVLPRIEGEGADVRLSNEARSRYEPVKLLGAGGMGEVVLVEDQDIARRVAVKRLLPEMTQPAVLARFIDEIRTVGRLEHPNIVPIHDVGVDELGRYFFVMKYVEGETLESIIDKLAAGDAGYLRKYTYERRIEIFLGILHALEYAHEHGVVHRDIKPANVMIGRFGEVMLMDWGVAKSTALSRDPASGADAELGEEGARGRAFATRVGSIIGTPAYMSPEQARGENDKIDARSDLFSAAALFHEFASLRHYRHDAQTLEQLLLATATERRSFPQLHAACHPDAQPPAELVHFVHRGLGLAPDDRFQSAAEMILALEGILEGKVQVQCHVTLTKRVTRELGRFVDRRPHAAFLALLGATALLVFAIVQAVRAVVA
jgi:serine/threonine-protein kinase